MLLNVIQYTPEEEEAPLEPLRLEHFYLPLVLWLAGLALSTLSFIAEIIARRIKRNDGLQTSRLCSTVEQQIFLV